MFRNPLPQHNYRKSESHCPQRGPRFLTFLLLLLFLLVVPTCVKGALFLGFSPLLRLRVFQQLIVEFITRESGEKTISQSKANLCTERFWWRAINFCQLFLVISTMSPGHARFLSLQVKSRSQRNISQQKFFKARGGLLKSSPIDVVPNGGVVLAQLLVGEADLLPVIHGQRGRLEVSVQVRHGEQLVREFQPRVSRREQLRDRFPEASQHIC